MTKIGYARVSTRDQKLDRQIEVLTQYGVDEILTEKESGASARTRPVLMHLLENLEPGDYLVIESLSRLGRSTKDLLTIIERLDAKGIVLVSTKESIDISTPTGKLLVSVLSAICQFERDITVQRTLEGLEEARKQGRIGGRPKIMDEKISTAMKMYYTEAFSIREICDLLKISRSSFYNYKKQYDKEYWPES